MLLQSILLIYKVYVVVSEGRVLVLLRIDVLSYGVELIVLILDSEF